MNKNDIRECLRHVGHATFTPRDVLEKIGYGDMKHLRDHLQEMERSGEIEVVHRKKACRNHPAVVVYKVIALDFAQKDFSDDALNFFYAVPKPIMDGDLHTYVNAKET